MGGARRAMHGRAHQAAASQRRAATRAILLAAMAASCAAGPCEFLGRPEQPVAWPPPPAPARLEAVFAYHGSDDVRRDPGFFERLLALVAGADRHSLAAPYGLALAADDTLLIADTGHAVVHRLSLRSGEHDVLRGALRIPVGVAAGPEGRIYVSDSAAGHIAVFDVEGRLTQTFGSGQLERPTGLVWDPRRTRLLVADTIGCRIAAYHSDGTLIETRGRRGTKPGEFNYPTNLALGSDGEVFVTDSMNFRVQILSPDLEPVGGFGLVGRGPGTFANPKGVALDSDGHIWVVDAMFDNVQVFRRDGALLLAVGSSGSSIGSFHLPSGIVIDSRNRVFVADAGNARIQMLQYHPLP